MAHRHLEGRPAAHLLQHLQGCLALDVPARPGVAHRVEGHALQAALLDHPAPHPRGYLLDGRALPKAKDVSRMGAFPSVQDRDRVRVQGHRVALEPPLDVTRRHIVGAALQDRSQDRKIAVWISTPSAASLMMRLKQLTIKNLVSVRRFFFIGEPLLETHVNAIFSECPDAQVWNAYGPTEATVSMTCLKMTADSYSTAVTTSVALGTAIPGMELHVLGGESADEGELVIVGPQLAEGYWNDPEHTARAFRSVGFSGTTRRAYFSGDWVRVSKGQVYFQSRLDHQVKIDGFRLELDEVAAAIRSLGWTEVVVMKLDGQLTAIIENKAHTDAALIEKELHGRLQTKLERYAIPSRFVIVEEFPRNLNDKIDLQALAALAQAQGRTSP